MMPILINLPYPCMFHLKSLSMPYRIVLLFALLKAGILIGQDQKPKWDVSAPEGLTYTDHRFTVTEGTWMNLDVSPDGKTIAFDLLGDIYTMPVSGGTATCIRSGLPWEVQPRFSPDGTRILFTSDAGGGDNIWVMDVDGAKARPITKETFRLLNNATWMPDGQHIVARKHFTNTRSLGAGELWVYHTGGGDGLQLTKRKNDQQDVNEPSVSPDGRYVYFSEDMYSGGSFQYNKDPLKQITAIRRYDRKEGKTEEVTGGSGGACRPQISPDGHHLAFVRRVDTKSVLFVRDLGTGLEFPIYDRLDKDQQEAWTIFGVYTGFNWMPTAGTADTRRHILIWAGGKIKKISFNPETLDQRDAVAGQVRVAEIPFSCTVNTRLAETLRPEQTVYEPRFKAKAVRQAVTSPDGRHLVFNAAGHLYAKTLPDGTPRRLLPDGVNGYRSGTQTWSGNVNVLAYEPAFSPDGNKLAFVTWSDQMGGGLWVMDFPSGTPTQLKGAGIYRQPAFSPDGKSIAYVSASGDDEVGPTLERKPGVYVLDAEAEAAFIAETGEQPRFSADGSRILVSTGGSLFGGLSKELVSYNRQGADKRVLFKSKYATNWTPSPDGRWLAFTELYKTYVCAMPDFGQTVDLSADTKSVPLTQVSRDAGYNLHWSADSKSLFYTLGDAYYQIDLNQRFAFLPGAPDSLPPLPEQGLDIGLTLEYDTPQGVIALTNARIITCEGGTVIENGTIEVTQNKITYLGKASGYKKPVGAVEVDCKGKTIMPGLVDVHSHSGNFRSGLNPEKQWEYHANLAYGVTTMHDPSVNSEMAFSNAEMLKAGEMTGPRLFSTGTILYGADGDFKAPINSLDDARSALRRTKAWGAISVKSYNQPRRDQRQQVMAAAKELDMLVVPEGGSFFYHNLTQVADGHTGVEHNLPVATVYDDVIQFWKRTTAHNTPTLIVCYGAVNGEYYFFQKEDIWKKQPLRHFTPGHVLDQRARHRTMIPEEEYENGHILVSKSLRKMQDNGIPINLGSHGQLQGLGAHWELWMLQQGGMSNLQALQCATINGAKYLGMDKEIGSLKTGKLADLIVLEANPLENIRHTERIRQVMVNGRLYDASTIRERGHYDKAAEPFWFHQPGRSGGHSGMTHSCLESKCVCGH
jgi:imidazolonepropionase-like amidohydrolase/Tol biopolymer transport system component